MHKVKSSLLVGFFQTTKRFLLGALGVYELPYNVTFTAAPGAANVAEVTVAVKDAEGNAIAKAYNFDLWLSDAATGLGVTASTASGTVVAKAASGTDLVDLTAKKVKKIQTKVDGTYILQITDTVKTLFFVAVAHPVTGQPIVSAQLTTPNYG